MSHIPAPASSEAGRETSRSTPEGSLTVGDVVALVEAAAPPGLAASWDSNGLICGDPADPVRSILLAVDPVAAVVDEAIDSDVDMIITHHPLYLRGTDHVAATDPKGRSIHRLIRAGIALLNAHTSLDAAHGGVAEALADRVGLTSASPLEPDPASPDQGIGRIGVLPHPVTLRQLASDVAAALPDSAPGLLVGGDLDAVVERIAVSGGAGDSLLQRAREAGAGLFLTRRPTPPPRLRAPGGRSPLPSVRNALGHRVVGLEPLACRLEEGARSHGGSLAVQVSCIVTDPWVLRLSTGSDRA